MQSSGSRFVGRLLLILLLIALPRTAYAAVLDIRDVPNGIECASDQGKLRIIFVTDQIVRVTATPNPGWSTAGSLMRAPLDQRPGPIARQDQGQAVSLASRQLLVKLDRNTGGIQFCDPAGRVLLGASKSPRAFERTAVLKSVPDPASMHKVQTVDGEREIFDKYVQAKDRDAWKATAHFQLRDEEALYGLGFDETADLNLRGKTKRLYQHNMRILVPSLVSTAGYGLLFDAYSAMTFSDGKEGLSIGCDVVDDLDYYFVLGPSMDGAVAGLRTLTGPATMLPRWAFGYIQSKERYKTQEDLVQTLQKFRSLKIPIDVIVQDWNYWTPGRWGSLVPEASRYPDIGQMAKTVHDLNARLMISIWPNPSPADPPGAALRDAGFTLAGTTYVDFFQPRGADLYFEQVWHYLGQHGIDAWWCDSTEPVVADWGGQRPADPDAVNIARLATLIDPQNLNAYGLLDAQGFYRNWRKTVPEKRLVNLTRSGYAGSQAVGAVVWTGDTSAKWSVLAQQVAAVQSCSASGIPYVTFDVGGFFVQTGAQWFRNGDYNRGVQDSGYRELYTRWLQLGAFLPMFRSHGSETPREPWHFGEPGTPFYDAIVEAIQMRYRLLPHIYSQAGLVSLRGASFIKPVAFEYPADANTHDLKTQLLFGQGMMISPVLTAMEYGPGSTPLSGVPKTRDVYLPEGSWVDFWTGKPQAGQRTVTCDAPLARIPIHVRAGSIIPMGPVEQYAGERADAPLEIRVYPGADGTYLLYEDAGEGWGYEHGEYSLIPMHWDDRAGKLTLGPRQGSFPGMARQREFKVVVVSSSAGKGIDAADDALSVPYQGEETTIQPPRP